MSSADQTVLRYAREYEIGQATTPRATGTLTSTGNPADTDTVTINGKVYTFQTTLTNVDGNVLIGASAAASLLNLMHAINLSGGVPGTDYAAAMTLHPTIYADYTTATTLVVLAKTGGTGGNALTTTESSTSLSWGAGTLAGGAAGPALKQVRYTGESLNFNIENTKTAELTPDRVETDLIQTGASAAGDINVELSFDSFHDFIEAVLCGRWATTTGDQSEVQNGTILRSFLVQKYFADMDEPEYHNFAGTCMESLSLKMEIGKIVEGAFSTMAFGVTVSASQVASATFPAVTSTSPMNAVTNLQNFTVDGVPYEGCISSLGLQIKNNIRAIQCLGSIQARNMVLGTMEVTGDMEFYFNEGSNYTKFVNGTEFAFAFDLEDTDGNVYNFDFPRCKFETGEVVAGGRNTDVMFSAKWRGLKDSVTGRVLRITRNPV